MYSSYKANIMDTSTQSVTEHMFSTFDDHLDNIALVDMDTGRSVTYKELKSLIIKAAHGFQAMGFKEGDIVCVCSTNSVDYAVVFFALASFGAILQATNPLYTKGEIITQFEQCKTNHVITIPSLLDKIKESINNNVKEIIIIGGIVDDKRNGCIPFEKVISLGEGNSDLKKVTFDLKKTPACYIFSSGTTGLPKAVMLSHFNIVANLLHLRGLVLNESDSILVFLPFFHLYGLFGILCSALTYGAKLIIMSRFLPVPFMETIQKYQITVLHVVPPVMVVLAKYPTVQQFNLTCVRMVVCGAAPLSKDIELKVKEIFKVDFISQGYGMSECMITHMDTKGHHKPGSVGKVINGIKHKIIDVETQEVVGPNCNGEVCIQGPQIMIGYLNQPEVTAAMIGEDGWLTTGDVGYIDEEGFLFIVDRIKELIKYKGSQVAPAELEALLLKHPSILDAGVIGIPDLDAGELPKAFVVLKKDAKLSAQDIQDYVQENASPHKKLRGGVEFIDSIPKSASGKILRRVLRDRKN